MGNVSKLVEEGQITNEVILETIESAKKLYLEKPTNMFISTFVVVTILSTLYLKLLKPVTNNANSNSPNSQKRLYKSSFSGADLANLLNEAAMLYQETIDFLEEHYELLKEMAEILIKKETLDEEVDALILKHTANEGASENIVVHNFDQDDYSKEMKRRGFSQFLPDKLIPDIMKGENLAKKKED